MPALEPPAIEIQYVGGPTTLLTIDGLTVITDPTFDAPGKEYSVGPVTLKKLLGPAVQPGELKRVDLALVSHAQHADNLDESGRTFLKNVTTVLTTQTSAQELGGGAIGLAPWESRTVRSPSGREFRITAAPGRHGPPGIEKFAGDVVGFVITDVAAQRDLVYVTGDTVWYEGTIEVAKRFKPRVVLLFAGAARTRGPFHLTMDCNDAVEAAAAFNDAVIVPVHHEGWAHFTQSQDDLSQTFTALGFEHRLRRVEPGKVIRLQ